MTSANLYKNAALLYFLSLAFLLSLAYTIEYPVDDEASYIAQTNLLTEGKTQPNWLLSTSYITMLVGMPVIKYALSFFNLRLLMMMIAATTTPLMYLILREIGAKRDIAILGALVLLTNPFVATYLRQFITEPISLPLYLLSALFIIRSIRWNDNKFLSLGVFVGILGFLNRQTDIIPVLAALSFFLIQMVVSKEKQSRNVFRKKIVISSPVLVFLLAFFSYLYFTTGAITNKITVPYTNEHALLNPQFGISIQSPYRLLQDLIYLGFMFLPFALFTRKYLKPKIEILGRLLSKDVILLIGPLLMAVLVVILGKAFIFHEGGLIAFISAALFSYSGISLSLYILQNRTVSNISSYSFIVLVGCVLFTFFKIGVFIIKYYIIFLPFILVFLALKIKERMPYVLTILVLGGFGVLMTTNVIQFYEKLWCEVDKLLANGIEPTDIQGQYTLDNWLSNSVDNPTGKYRLVWDRHAIFNELVDVNSVKSEVVR